MPDRIIRDQCRRSPTLQRLSDAAERAWWRLTVYHDDYGRFEADAEVLLAGLMARRPAGWTKAKMQRAIQEWADASDPLIHLYQVPGDLRIYGHAITTTKHQRERESKPKYPDPPCGNLPQDAAKCGESLQLAAYSESRESGVGKYRESRGESRPPGSPQLAANGWGAPEDLVRLYNERTPDNVPMVKPPSFRPGTSLRTKLHAYLRLFPEQAWWEEVFAQYKRSKFLRGAKPPSPGHEGFKPDLAWLLSKGKGDQVENCVKVHDGKYADG